jgi:hypothetical protein
MNSSTSPLPWSVERTNANGWKGISIKDANGHAIAYMVMQPAGDNEMANAKAIINAVNAQPAQGDLIPCQELEQSCHSGRNE